VIATGPLRRAEVLAVLALATDLAMGHPHELAMRAGLLAGDLAERLGVPREDAHLVAQLRFIGCTAHASEVSRVFGDEIAFRARIALADPADGRQVLPLVLRRAGAGRRGAARVVAAARAVTGAAEFLDVNFRTSCEAAQLLAARLDLGDAVRRGLWHAFERWDGRGVPNAVAGEAVEPTARIALLAVDVLVLQAARGRDEALAAAAARSGGAYDPDVVAALDADLMGAAYAGSAWERVLAAAPDALYPDVDDALTVLADFTDVKFPALLGHSRAVARLAEAAMVELGAAAQDVRAARWAGLVHDLGRIAVPNSIWEKPGPLSDAEHEQVRLHAYQGERLLSRVPALAAVVRIAGAHHERCDGSGYFRGSRAAGLPLAARVVAAADVYAALVADRPHRAAFTPTAALAEMRAEVAAGRLDRKAVDAVLAAAGHAVKPAADPAPDGLTPREVEVLRLVARGLTNRQIARTLVISERTVAHHVGHILTRTGVSTRAAAALYAVQHGLLDLGP
jgi:putative nucleotidyltransferase with HDIG domain